MLAIQNKNIQSNENQNIQQKICEYKGLTYFVLTDMNGKCFINVDGKRKYLDKNGCVCNKQRGKKSIKTAIENFEDIFQSTLPQGERHRHMAGKVVVHVWKPRFYT